MGLVLLAAGRASALGLGDAVGTAIVGEPLRIEIPLLGSETPSPGCFRVVPPTAEVGIDFVLRNARVDVVGERGGSKLIVTTTAAVREPIVGFAVSAGCNFGLTRDYILLSAMAPVAPTVAPAVAAAPMTAPAGAPSAPTAAPSAPAAPAIAPAAAPAPQRPETAAPQRTMAGETLRLDADATLTALARKKYPLQPKAREKFVRMMMHANPDLADREAPIAAGTVLQVPPGLPLRREGSLPAPQVKPAEPKPAAPAVAVPQAKPKANPNKDRLMLSAGPDTSEAKLLDEAERLTATMLEQAKAQEELLASIARLEASYAAVRKDFMQMESRLNAMEAERKAEKAAAASSMPDLVMLMLAVLGGGAMGGLGLHFYQRRKPKPDTGKPEAPWWTVAENAARPAPRPKLSSLGQAPAASSQADVLDFHTQPEQKKS